MYLLNIYLLIQHMETTLFWPMWGISCARISYLTYLLLVSLVLKLFFFLTSFDVITFIVRRKTETENCPSRSKTASPYAVQGPYAFSDIAKLPHTAPVSSMPADMMTKYFCTPSQDSQCDDYENVTCMDRESGFVTNDIYETCRAQNRQAGWVENEIYG